MNDRFKCQSEGLHNFYFYFDTLTGDLVERTIPNLEILVKLWYVNGKVSRKMPYSVKSLLSSTNFLATKEAKL